MTPLRQRMIDDLKLRNRSPRTITAYVSGVARFAKFHQRSPEQLGLEDVRTYQKHLLEAGASWATFNVAVCALKFLYGVTLQVPWQVEQIPYGHRRQRTWHAAGSCSPCARPPHPGRARPRSRLLQPTTCQSAPVVAPVGFDRSPRSLALPRLSLRRVHLPGGIPHERPGSQHLEHLHADPAPVAGYLHPC
jgi:hypothetical protein